MCSAVRIESSWTTRALCRVTSLATKLTYGLSQITSSAPEVAGYLYGQSIFVGPSAKSSRKTSTGFVSVW